jgi:hypothetical protein
MLCFKTALFQFMTLSWADVTRQVASEYYWAWPLFTTFVYVTSFILFSLIVAVVCDAVMQGERGDMIGDKELRVRLKLLRRNIRKLTERQEKLKILAVKSCSLVGIERVSFVDTLRKNSSPKRDASACSLGGLPAQRAVVWCFCGRLGKQGTRRPFLRVQFRIDHSEKSEEIEALFHCRIQSFGKSIYNRQSQETSGEGRGHGLKNVN